jgi:hypothetical protein
MPLPLPLGAMAISQEMARAQAYGAALPGPVPGRPPPALRLTYPWECFGKERAP